MSPEILEAAFTKILNCSLVGGSLAVVWHAGEPLVLSPSWYTQAFAIAERVCPPALALRHTFQTNGTLLSADWTSFFRRTSATVSLSIDGPDWLHNQQRINRAGLGTHASSMRGLRLLQEAGVSAAILTVLTAETLNHADALFDFYRDEAINDVAFNVEEREGAHATTSLKGDDAELAYRDFMRRFIARMSAEPNTLKLREFTNALDVIRYGGVATSMNQEAEPMRIISISVDGSISTFSPELLGMPDPYYDNFVFGNILDDEIDVVVERVLASKLRTEIASGIANCRRTCARFKWCGGGSPSNKIFENGSALSTETSYCRLTRQILVDVVVDRLTDRSEIWQ